MTQSKLNQYEDARKEYFSGNEIRELLQKDAKTGELKNLHNYFRVHKQELEQLYGSENPVEAFRHDLKKRLQNIKNLLYYKKIEDGVSNKVASRLGQTATDVRQEIESILGADTVLTEEELIELRNSDIAHFYSRSFRVDDTFVSNYRDLVRYELKQQIEAVGKLDPDKQTLEQEEAMRDVYERAEFLLDFIVSHVSGGYGEQAYLKAYLLRKIGSTEGTRMIRDLYSEIDSALSADNSEQFRSRVNQLSTHFQVNATLEKKAAITTMLGEHVSQVSIDEEVIDHILAKTTDGKNELLLVDRNGVSYHERLCRHLEEIETAVFDITLERMLEDSEGKQERIEGHRGRISQETSKLRQLFKEFDQQYNSLEVALDKQSYWLSDEKKKELLEAERALSSLREESSMGEEAKTYLSAFTNEKQVGEYIENAKKETRTLLIKGGVSETALDDMEHTDPFFNIFEYAGRHSKEERRAEPQKDSEAAAVDSSSQKSALDKNEPIITDEYILKEVRQQLETMTECSERRFAEPNDAVAFDKAHQDIKRLLKGQEYVPEKTGSAEGLQMEKKAKSLPFDEQQRLNTLLQKRQQDERFGHLNELLFSGKLEKTENPKMLRVALEALYGGSFEVPRGRAALQKLSQVMILDHPVTCIRFNAADQKPFYNNGVHQIHRLPGKAEPATYRDRAQYLLQEVKKHLQQGDYVALQGLFRTGALADRLFLDASFFPVNSIRKKGQEIPLLHDPVTEDDATGKEVVTGWKISEKRISRESDRDFFSKQYQDLDDRFDPSTELPKLEPNAQCLMENGEHIGTFQLFTEEERQEEQLAAIEQFQNALQENTDGTYSLNEDVLDEMAAHVNAGGEVKSLGIPAGAAGMTRKRMEAIAKDYPLIAGRMMQMRSMGLGGAIGATEMAARWGLGKARVAGSTPFIFLEQYWKNLNFYSPYQIWMAVDQMIEHIRNLSDFYVKIGSYDLLQNVFDGTLVGNEFSKLYQGEEDRRVNEFKDAMQDYGHDDVIAMLYSSSDQFQLKAAFLEGTERGIFTLEDFLDPRLFRQLNKHAKIVKLPKYDKETMLQDEEIQFKVLDKLRESIDTIWGTGTWQTWRSSNSSKYESEKQSAMKNFEGNSVREKDRWYKYYWSLLQTPSGIKKLRKLHPAELVGNIEQDMLQGDRDCGETFAIMQSMICMGLVKLDHVRRLQTAHSNDLPIHALLEPGEAEASGLTAFIKNCIKKGYDYDPDTNPLIEFYQGKKAIPLKAVRHNGKWRFVKTMKDAAAAGSNHQRIVTTVHQLQKNREAQPEYFRKMDNCCIGLFTPCYSWNQIEGAMNPNTQGKIEARSHDMIAAYRGIHHEFAAYMEAMADTSLVNGDIKTFKRQVWYAYEALTKTQAFAAFFTRHIDRAGRDLDFTMNSFDGSPNFASDHTERRMQTKTNFETLLLGVDGPHQRMAESGAHLDSLEVISDDLRAKFKEMAGFQFVKDLGLNPATGKADPATYVPFDYRTYNPSQKWREVIPVFMDNVIALANRHGFGAEIRDSLQRSKMGDLDPANNNERQVTLKKWAYEEAKL